MLAKYAQALDIPLYQIFYDGEEVPKKIKGLDLDGKKLSLSERREIQSLGRQFSKLESARQRACALTGCEVGTVRFIERRSFSRGTAAPGIDNSGDVA